MMNKDKHSGFTLIEVMIVITLLGIIAGFAIPNYQNSIRKSHERDAISQLTLIKAANDIYRSQSPDSSNGFTKQYLQTADLTNQTGYTDAHLADVNDELDLNILGNGLEYSYESTSQTNFEAFARYSEGASVIFTIRVNERNIDQDAASPERNPCCSGGTCITLGDC